MAEVSFLSLCLAPAEGDINTAPLLLNSGHAY
uniref:Uncharacterized protein n=1 Tax=Siphoviridae sp. ctClL93 TaxID=2825381 RepID=A0A8S5VE84_9CAUD|nr:MAG TPA: hypothetical protein [Siphoviridae sp. ctClL93]DAO70674.1 MAG TPA: hypothetical protein [Caudoviricetes sp.]